MIQNLPLSEEVVLRLRQAAADEKTTPEGWIVDRLPPQSLSEEPQSGNEATKEQIVPMPGSMLEKLLPYLGTVEGSGTDYSKDGSRLFGDYLEEKRREGRL